MTVWLVFSGWMRNVDGETDDELRARIAKNWQQHWANVRARDMREMIAESIEHSPFFDLSHIVIKGTVRV